MKEKEPNPFYDSQQPDNEQFGDQAPDNNETPAVSRRTFLKGAAALAGAAFLGDKLKAEEPENQEEQPAFNWRKIKPLKSREIAGAVSTQEGIKDRALSFYEGTPGVPDQDRKLWKAMYNFLDGTTPQLRYTYDERFIINLEPEKSQIAVPASEGKLADGTARRAMNEVLRAYDIMKDSFDGPTFLKAEIKDKASRKTSDGKSWHIYEFDVSPSESDQLK